MVKKSAPKPKLKINASGFVTPKTENDGAPDPKMVQACRSWIRKHVSPTKTVRPGFTSYSYKHFVEKWHGDYITNGAFIAAAIAEGYQAVRDPHSTGWNALFNMSRPKLKDRVSVEDRE